MQSLLVTFLPDLLGQYIDPASLKRNLQSTWSGSTITLTNVCLRDAFLSRLDLPLVLTEGTVEQITLTVPGGALGVFSRLYTEPVRISVRGVRITVTPRQEVTASNNGTGTSSADHAAQLADDHLLYRHAILEQCLERHTAGVAAKAPADGAGSTAPAAPPRGLLKAVLALLQVEITDVLVCVRAPGAALKCAIASLSTVGTGSGVSGGTARLRQGSLAGLALHLEDCTNAKTPPGYSQQQPLLSPASAELVLQRSTAGAAPGGIVSAAASVRTPDLSLELRLLSSLCLTLAPEDVCLLLRISNSFQAKSGGGSGGSERPCRRPLMRPARGASARAWWAFALSSVLRSFFPGRRKPWRFRRLPGALALRSSYLTLYEKVAQADILEMSALAAGGDEAPSPKAAGAATANTLTPAPGSSASGLEHLEAVFELAPLLEFRALARAAAASAVAASAAAGALVPPFPAAIGPQSPPPPPRATSWVKYLLGRGKRPPLSLDTIPPTAAPGSDSITVPAPSLALLAGAQGVLTLAASSVDIFSLVRLRFSLAAERLSLVVLTLGGKPGLSLHGQGLKFVTEVRRRGMEVRIELGDVFATDDCAVMENFSSVLRRQGSSSSSNSGTAPPPLFSLRLDMEPQQAEYVGWDSVLVMDLQPLAVVLTPAPMRALAGFGSALLHKPGDAKALLSNVSSGVQCTLIERRRQRHFMRIAIAAPEFSLPLNHLVNSSPVMRLCAGSLHFASGGAASGSARDTSPTPAPTAAASDSWSCTVEGFGVWQGGEALISPCTARVQCLQEEVALHRLIPKLTLQVHVSAVAVDVNRTFLAFLVHGLKRLRSFQQRLEDDKVSLIEHLPAAMDTPSLEVAATRMDLAPSTSLAASSSLVFSLTVPSISLCLWGASGMAEAARRAVSTSVPTASLNDSNWRGSATLLELERGVLEGDYSSSQTAVLKTLEKGSLLMVWEGLELFSDDSCAAGEVVKASIARVLCKSVGMEREVLSCGSSSNWASAAVASDLALQLLLERSSPEIPWSVKAGISPLEASLCPLLLSDALALAALFESMLTLTKAPPPQHSAISAATVTFLCSSSSASPSKVRPSTQFPATPTAFFSTIAVRLDSVRLSLLDSMAASAQRPVAVVLMSGGVGTLAQVRGSVVSRLTATISNLSLAEGLNEECVLWTTATTATTSSSSSAIGNEALTFEVQWSATSSDIAVTATWPYLGIIAEPLWCSRAITLATCFANAFSSSAPLTPCEVRAPRAEGLFDAKLLLGSAQLLVVEASSTGRDDGNCGAATTASAATAPRILVVTIAKESTEVVLQQAIHTPTASQEQMASVEMQQQQKLDTKMSLRMDLAVDFSYLVPPSAGNPYPSYSMQARAGILRLEALKLAYCHEHIASVQDICSNSVPGSGAVGAHALGGLCVQNLPRIRHSLSAQLQGAHITSAGRDLGAASSLVAGWLQVHTATSASAAVQDTPTTTAAVDAHANVYEVLLPAGMALGLELSPGTRVANRCTMPPGAPMPLLFIQRTKPVAVSTVDAPSGLSCFRDGDVLLSVDGKCASTLPLPTLARILTSGRGTSCTLRFLALRTSLQIDLPSVLGRLVHCHETRLEDEPLARVEASMAFSLQGNEVLQGGGISTLLLGAGVSPFLLEARLSAAVDLYDPLSSTWQPLLEPTLPANPWQASLRVERGHSSSEVGVVAVCEVDASQMEITLNARCAEILGKTVAALSAASGVSVVRLLGAESAQMRLPLAPLAEPATHAARLHKALEAALPVAWFTNLMPFAVTVRTGPGGGGSGGSGGGSAPVSPFYTVHSGQCQPLHLENVAGGVELSVGAPVRHGGGIRWSPVVSLQARREELPVLVAELPVRLAVRPVPLSHLAPDIVGLGEEEEEEEEDEGGERATCAPTAISVVLFSPLWLRDCTGTGGLQLGEVPNAPHYRFGDVTKSALTSLGAIDKGIVALHSLPADPSVLIALQQDTYSSEEGSASCVEAAGCPLSVLTAAATTEMHFARLVEVGQRPGAWSATPIAVALDAPPSQLTSLPLPLPLSPLPATGASSPTSCTATLLAHLSPLPAPYGSFSRLLTMAPKLYLKNATPFPLFWQAGGPAAVAAPQQPPVAPHASCPLWLPSTPTDTAATISLSLPHLLQPQDSGAPPIWTPPIALTSSRAASGGWCTSLAVPGPGSVMLRTVGGPCLSGTLGLVISVLPADHVLPGAVVCTVSLQGAPYPLAPPPWALLRPLQSLPKEGHQPLSHVTPPVVLYNTSTSYLVFRAGESAANSTATAGTTHCKAIDTAKLALAWDEGEVPLLPSMSLLRPHVCAFSPPGTTVPIHFNTPTPVHCAELVLAVVNKANGLGRPHLLSLALSGKAFSQYSFEGLTLCLQRCPGTGVLQVHVDEKGSSSSSSSRMGGGGVRKLTGSTKVGAASAAAAASVVTAAAEVVTAPVLPMKAAAQSKEIVKVEDMWADLLPTTATPSASTPSLALKPSPHLFAAPALTGKPVLGKLGAKRLGGSMAKGGSSAGGLIKKDDWADDWESCRAEEDAKPVKASVAAHLALEASPSCPPPQQPPPPPNPPSAAKQGYKFGDFTKGLLFGSPTPAAAPVAAQPSAPSPLPPPPSAQEGYKFGDLTRGLVSAVSNYKVGDLSRSVVTAAANYQVGDITTAVVGAIIKEPPPPPPRTPWAYLANASPLTATPPSLTQPDAGSSAFWMDSLEGAFTSAAATPTQTPPPPTLALSLLNFLAHSSTRVCLGGIAVSLVDGSQREQLYASLTGVTLTAPPRPRAPPRAPWVPTLTLQSIRVLDVYPHARHHTLVACGSSRGCSISPAPAALTLTIIPTFGPHTLGRPASLDVGISLLPIATCLNYDLLCHSGRLQQVCSRAFKDFTRAALGVVPQMTLPLTPQQALHSPTPPSSPFPTCSGVTLETLLWSPLTVTLEYSAVRSTIGQGREQRGYRFGDYTRALVQGKSEGGERTAPPLPPFLASLPSFILSFLRSGITLSGAQVELHPPAFSSSTLLGSKTAFAYATQAAGYLQQQLRVQLPSLAGVLGGALSPFASSASLALPRPSPPDPEGATVAAPPTPPLTRLQRPTYGPSPHHLLPYATDDAALYRRLQALRQDARSSSGTHTALALSLLFWCHLPPPGSLALVVTSQAVQVVTTSGPPKVLWRVGSTSLAQKTLQVRVAAAAGRGGSTVLSLERQGKGALSVALDSEELAAAAASACQSAIAAAVAAAASLTPSSQRSVATSTTAAPALGDIESVGSASTGGQLPDDQQEKGSWLESAVQASLPTQECAESIALKAARLQHPDELACLSVHARRAAAEAYFEEVALTAATTSAALAAPASLLPGLGALFTVAAVPAKLCAYMGLFGEMVAVGGLLLGRGVRKAEWEVLLPLVLGHYTGTFVVGRHVGVDVVKIPGGVGETTPAATAAAAAAVPSLVPSVRVISAGAEPQRWTLAGLEGQTLLLSAPTEVRYGAPPCTPSALPGGEQRWLVRQGCMGRLPLENAAFGIGSPLLGLHRDPAEGTRKQAEVGWRWVTVAQEGDTVALGGCAGSTSRTLRFGAPKAPPSLFFAGSAEGWMEVKAVEGQAVTATPAALGSDPAPGIHKVLQLAMAASPVCILDENGQVCGTVCPGVSPSAPQPPPPLSTAPPEQPSLVSSPRVQHAQAAAMGQALAPHTRSAALQVASSALSRKLLGSISLGMNTWGGAGSAVMQAAPLGIGLVWAGGAAYRSLHRFAASLLAVLVMKPGEGLFERGEGAEMVFAWEKEGS